jgi:hypothetical protein
MKTIIPAILFFVFIEASCQFMPKRSVGITLMPDYGMGVIYSQYFGHVGVYGSYAHTILGFSSRRFDSSQKASLGIILLSYGPNTKYPFAFSIGTDYNTYKGLQPDYKKNPHTGQPFDLQLGVSKMVNLINVGFRYDVFKNEASVDLSVNFGRQLIKYRR